ncbi:MAG: Leucine dehydrogenase [Myxococcota bacterium]|nr:Leucine dehydrogenase [Myxococcota bacterium]
MTFQLFDTLAASRFEDVHFFQDNASGLRAIIAIHSTARGPALGGTRMVPYPSDEAALRDVLNLSRAMSFKAAMAGLDHGGGKAVILRPADNFDRKALFTAFGRAVQSLGGRYITTEDSGTSPADMAIIRNQTRFVMGRPIEDGGSGDPSPMTAYGVYRGMLATVRHHLNREGLDGLTVAIQGVGHVGYPLAKLAREAGAKLVVADINHDAVERARAELGAAVVSTDEIAGVECDIYAPCALGGAINDSTLPRLRCKIVAGAANNQLANEEVHGAGLAARGVLYAPDYVINAGGLINVATEWTGYEAEKARGLAHRIHDTLLELFRRARAEGVRPEVLSERMAWERIQAAKH